MIPQTKRAIQPTNCKRLAFCSGIVLDKRHHVADGVEILRLIVVDRQAELVLKRHEKRHNVERIGTQILENIGGGGNLVLVDAELIGKHLVLIANLKPAKIRGIESRGMLLSADHGDKLQVVEVPGMRSGARIC